MSVRRFRNVYAGEVVTLSFRFTEELDVGETLTGTPTVEIVEILGVSSNPSSALLGLPAFNPEYNRVLQRVNPPAGNIEYRLRATATTSNSKTLVREGLLYVE